MTSQLSALFRKLGANPYILLLLTTLMWSANGIVSRMAIGEVSPMVIVVMRWLIASLILFGYAGRQIVADWQVLKHHLPLVAFGGTMGFTGFNAIFYIAAHHTSAVNMTILQGALPIFILIGAMIVFHARINLLQGAGILCTVLGVVAVAAQGDANILLSLSFNIGDIGLIIACLLYAIFTLSLRNRPKVSGIGFFSIMAVAAFITAIPLFGWEVLAGDTQWPTAKGWALILFIAICPSLLAQLFFLRAIDLIGPGRAAIFTNLVPIFGPILAVLVIGESFHLYHAIGLALVMGGIGLAEWKKMA
jgi:drug/metabolite transporter (DMT)-like permease